MQNVTLLKAQDSDLKHKFLQPNSEVFLFFLGYLAELIAKWFIESKLSVQKVTQLLKKPSQSQSSNEEAENSDVNMIDVSSPEPELEEELVSIKGMTFFFTF